MQFNEDFDLLSKFYQAPVPVDNMYDNVNLENVVPASQQEKRVSPLQFEVLQSQDHQVHLQ